MASVSSIARSLLARRSMLSLSSTATRFHTQRTYQMGMPAFTQQFSTAAEPAKKTKGKRRRTLANKDPIVVTERAADRIKELLEGENAKGAIGIILGVKRRGCNGLSYTLNYAFEEPKEQGAKMTAHGIQVFIEPMALFNVIGTEMDWEEDELTSEFTFNNPNSKGECGCGESFNV